jgi:hypothetical protein
VNAYLQKGDFDAKPPPPAVRIYFLFQMTGDEFREPEATPEVMEQGRKRPGWNRFLSEKEEEELRGILTREGFRKRLWPQPNRVPADTVTHERLASLDSGSGLQIRGRVLSSTPRDPTGDATDFTNILLVVKVTTVD